MRWKTLTIEHLDKRDWHQWFAWRPVSTEQGLTVWLEFVWRKVTPHYSLGFDFWIDKEYSITKPMKQRTK